MRISDIRVDGFGVWKELSVDNLSPGVTLFFGRNEAGKTTLMQFIRAVLYGFSPERRRLYLPPVFGGVPGGLLRVENHSGQFVIERRVSEKNDAGPGRIIVLAANGSRQGQHLLNVLLSGVDESIFNNVFAIGIRELQELATLNDTQAAELLYNLASGVDRVSLVEVMRDLESRRERILHPADGPCEISRWLAEQEKLAAEVAEGEALTRRWCDLASERASLIQELTQLEARIEELKHSSRTVEIAIQVHDRWHLRAAIERELAECGHVEKLPEGSVERLDEINAQILQQQEHIKPLRQKRLEIRRQLAAQPINQTLWNEKARIEAICEHGPWIDSLDGEIRGLQKEIEAAERELLKHEEKLAAEGGVKLAHSPIVSPRTVQQLQPAAVSLREAIKKRSVARKQQKKHRQEEEQAAQELKGGLAGRKTEDLEEALRRTGDLVSQLRRRIKLEERLEELRREQEEAEQEHLVVLDSQTQRVRVLIGIGAMFVFGFVLVLTGIFGWKIMPLPAEISWGVFFLGLVCLGLSSAWKVVLERTSQEELNACLSRRDAVDHEIQATVEEREHVDRELPAGSGNLASRLAAAERELKELEAMRPLHEERLEARRRIQETRRHASGAEDELREARVRWRRALRQAGLPESLAPKQVRQLGAHHQKKSKIEDTLRRLRERMAKLQADRNALVERLRQLHQNIGIHAVSEDPQIQLSQIAAALAGQKEMVQRRKELQGQERDIRRQLSAGLQQIRRLRRAREALFAEARVAEEEQLRQRAAQLQRAAALRQQQQALTDQIMALLAGHCTEQQIAGELADQSAEDLRARWEDLLARLHSSQAHLAQLHQRRGEISQEMKTLAENRRPAAARFELACVSQKLAEATREWRILTVTWHLLERIRRTYEAERQPETLEEASMYLERLTEGKYARVWTPLGRNELRIDDREGKPLPLEVLSRGTREAVFLSLRLALVASYGRRGINIPMVLDDVLVNLDAQRAEAAVAMLCDFARDGRQMLFFTCHEHIRQMFHLAQVDVRILPSHGTPGARVLPLEIPPTPPAQEQPAAEETPAGEEPQETAAEETAAPEPVPTSVPVPREPAAELPRPAVDEPADEEALIAHVSEPEGPAPPDEPAWDPKHARLWDVSAEEEYVLQDAVERSPLVPPVDLAAIAAEVLKEPEGADARPQQEPARQDRELPIREETPEFPEDVDRIFAGIPEEDGAGDGPWWDTACRLWPEEEETAA